MARMDRNASAMRVTAPRELTTPMIASLRVFDELELLPVEALLLEPPVSLGLLLPSPAVEVTESTENDGSTCSASVLYGGVSFV